MRPLSTRMKSLIKPPPARNSWELLLEDYLKDPKFKTNLTSQLSFHKMSTTPSSQTNSPDHFQQTFVPSSDHEYPMYSASIPSQQQCFLPPRRYKMTLDEIVYLISQVGRSDLYRELVQYINTQQPSTLSNISPLYSNYTAPNVDGSSTRITTPESLFTNNIKK